MLRAVDWCDLSLTERESNLGLGVSIRRGMQEVFSQHDSAIVFEDDLVCVKGTYNYMCAALARYRDDERVMSVTGWTHPSVTPSGSGLNPYFDGRSECWLWGRGPVLGAGWIVTRSALIADCRARGIDVYKYGADLLEMAEAEGPATSGQFGFLYLHILRGSLCLRPAAQPRRAHRLR